MWQRLKFWRQFSLKTLLLGMFVAAVACGAYRLGFKAGRSERLASKGADFDTLIQLITSTIAPTTWEDAGGEGRININGNCSLLIVDSSDGYENPFKARAASSDDDPFEEKAAET